MTLRDHVYYRSHFLQQQTIDRFDYESIQAYLTEHLLSQTSIKTIHAKRVRAALIKELCLTPKPGLVDMANSGSHKDMDFYTFVASIDAISGWLDAFYLHGMKTHQQPAHSILPDLRVIGIECEQAMFKATHQVNTHKGGIFAFGLILAAIGRLVAKAQSLHYSMICSEVSHICCDLVKTDLSQKLTQKENRIEESKAEKNNAKKIAPKTIGERLFLAHGLTGARGEAQSGYQTVSQCALPAYLKFKQQGLSEELALLKTLIYLLSCHEDTNLVSRGGMEGLLFAKEQANSLLQKSRFESSAFNPVEWKIELALLNQHFMQRNLSPGGSADLIAVTWFLAQYDQR